MEENMETTIGEHGNYYRTQSVRFRVQSGNEGVKNKMESTILGLGCRVWKEWKMEPTTMGDIGSLKRIHSFIPS